MKEKVKLLNFKTVSFKTKSYTKIITDKENIRTQDLDRRRVSTVQPPLLRKTDRDQSTLRYRKRKNADKLEARLQQIKRATRKNKSKPDEGCIRPAHSVELRRNKLNLDIHENRVYSLSAKKRDPRKKSIESVREIVKTSFNKTIQITPSSSFNYSLVSKSFQDKRAYMPTETLCALNTTKRAKPKSAVKKGGINRQTQTSKIIKKLGGRRKKSQADSAWPRVMLQDPVSDIIRLSTSQDKPSVAQLAQIQKVLLTDSQDFDLQELRQLQSRGNLTNNKFSHTFQGQSSKSYFNAMATRIQRFWRRCRTQKILSRHITPNVSHNNTIELPLQNLQFYGQYVPERHNTYISNLEDSQVSSKMGSTETYESVIKQIKIQEIQKWDQLIEMVEESIKGNQGTKDLLKKLLEKSQINKTKLEQNTEQLLASSHKKKQGASLRSSNSPQSFRRATNSPLQRSANSRNEKPRHQHKSESSVESKPIGQQVPDPVKPHAKIFNPKAIAKFVEEVALHDQCPQVDSIQTLITVQKLKKRLFELNSQPRQPDQKRIGRLDDSDSDASPALKRDRRSLQKQDSSDESQCSSLEEENEPTNILLRLINEDVDKEMVCQEISQSILAQEMTYLLQDMASNNRLFRQLKVYIKKGDEPQKSPKKSKKVKGMRTNLASVKQYIGSLGQFILCMDSQPLKSLEFPTGPTAAEMLRYMRFYDQEQDMSDDTENEIILIPQIFQQHWHLYSSTLSFGKSYEQPQKQNNHQDFLKRLSNIHCRSIFDTLNEGLDSLRNYGQFGKPFPWKHTPNFFHPFQKLTQKQSLQKAVQKTVENASAFCGLILDKEEYGSAPQPSTEYIQQMHEQRLSRALAQQLVEGEEKWLFYDDQETEILIEIAYSINEQIISEVADFILRHRE